MTPVTQILLLTIKPGKMDEFLEADRNFLASTVLPKGIAGSRLYRSPDGKSVVRVVQYESAEAQKEYEQDQALRQQVSFLRNFVESATAGFYEEVRTTGDFK
ncbi:antibiotic biosynthesis monooxygenase [Occallatibacter riparius]|uniref:Antibiotic biosynthesis monooxygenase n=1 Tax=Occallatibacter riparius TaxID=1002689 RepID=A0A9J7BMQ5_9BACT|nr:antibiotic biosynthesis monooxygenase [Occallatibacter riparius]UWZ84164.1 antibiotic biosynthesis monooxygenase [Occallatibacter riparius]